MKIVTHSYVETDSGKLLKQWSDGFVVYGKIYSGASKAAEQMAGVANKPELVVAENAVAYTNDELLDLLFNNNIDAVREWLRTKPPKVGKRGEQNEQRRPQQRHPLQRDINIAIPGEEDATLDYSDSNTDEFPHTGAFP